MIIRCIECDYEFHSYLCIGNIQCPLCRKIIVSIVSVKTENIHPSESEFVNIINKMMVIHQKKKEDYTLSNDSHENFKRAESIAKWFNDIEHIGYVYMIGIKLARLATLLNNKSVPNNESIEDTFIDLANYCVLWGARYKSKF